MHQPDLWDPVAPISGQFEGLVMARLHHGVVRLVALGQADAEGADIDMAGFFPRLFQCFQNAALSPVGCVRSAVTTRLPPPEARKPAALHRRTR